MNLRVGESVYIIDNGGQQLVGVILPRCRGEASLAPHMEFCDGEVRGRICANTLGGIPGRGGALGIPGVPKGPIAPDVDTNLACAGGGPELPTVSITVERKEGMTPSAAVTGNSYDLGRFTLSAGVRPDPDGGSLISCFTLGPNEKGANRPTDVVT